MVPIGIFSFTRKILDSLLAVANNAKWSLDSRIFKRALQKEHVIWIIFRQ